MGVPYENANEIICYFCNIFQMEKSKMHILLTELQSNQKVTSKMFSDKELKEWSLMKRGNRLVKFGFTDITLVLGLLIKYIDTDEGLLNICNMSKLCNEVLRDEILVQSLLRTDLVNIESKRKELWL